MDVAARIIELCEQQNITPKELSDLSRIPRTTLNQILHRKTKDIKLNTIRDVCFYFNISLSEFFSYETPTARPTDACITLKKLERFLKNEKEIDEFLKTNNPGK